MPTIYIAEETFPCILNELRVVLQGLGQVPLPGLAYLYALLAAETLDDDMASNDLRPDFAFDDDLGPDFAFDTRSSPTAVDTSPATSLVSSPAPAPSSCPSSPEPSLYSPSPTLGLSRHPSSFIPSLNLQQGSAPAADAHLGEPHPYPLRKRAHVTSNSESEELDSGFNGASHNASSTTNKRPRLLPGGDGGGDGGDDGEDPGHVVNWDITCRRNGNRSRVKGPGTGPGIVCEMAEEDDERGLFAFLHDQHGYEGDNDDDDEDDTQQDGNYEPPSAKIDHYINDNDDTYDNNVDYDDLPASDDANDEANTAPTTKHTRRKQPRQEDDADYIPPANKGRSKGENTGKKSRTWRKGARLPTISAAARRRIVTLCTITTKDPLDKLAQLVLSFSANQSIAVPEPEQQSPADDLAPLRALAIRCDELEVNVHRTELDFMITLIQLTLAVDVIRKGFTDKDCPSVGALGSQIGFTPNKFRDWVAHGTRLAYLVAAGTPWILLVIAALGMRACLTRRQDTVTEDIYSIAFTLRQPQDDDVGRMVRTVLIPFIISLRRIPIPNATFTFFSKSAPGNREIYGDREVDGQSLDRCFDRVTTNYFLLPPRSEAWLGSQVPPPSIQYTHRRVNDWQVRYVGQEEMVLKYLGTCDGDGRGGQDGEGVDEELNQEDHLGLAVKSEAARYGSEAGSCEAGEWDADGRLIL